MGGGDEYLLESVDALIARKETARPNYALCPVGPNHARDEADSSLLTLKMLRIQTAHTLTADGNGTSTIVTREDGSEIVVDRKARTVTVRGMVAWLLAAGAVTAGLLWFTGTRFGRSTDMQAQGQRVQTSNQAINFRDNVEIKKQLEIIRRLLNEQPTEGHAP